MANAFDREKQQFDILAKMVAGIERLSTVFRAALWEEAKHYNLSPLQVQILLFVAFHNHNQCNITGIAKEFAVTKATVSDAVKTLLEKKLLEKNATDDARGFLLSLTESGRNSVDRLSGLTDYFNNSLSHVPEAEISKIWEGILLLVGHLQKTEIIPVRMCFSCQHFGKDHNEGAPHYCHLMQKPLAINEVRIDCPEHLVRAVC
ncbi:MAG: MarR family winged helix-turn-helix transcriptional regulator [Rickettsiales bacterium]